MCQLRQMCRTAADQLLSNSGLFDLLPKPPCDAKAVPKILGQDERADG